MNEKALRKYAAEHFYGATLDRGTGRRNGTSQNDDGNDQGFIPRETLRRMERYIALLPKRGHTA